MNEFNSLIAELDDIANSTKWNGESLLNGTKSSIDIMVGEGEMMTIALPNTTSSGLGSYLLIQIQSPYYLTVLMIVTIL